jgi:hypothetical protein
MYFILNPKAKWQDGTPATAEDLKANVEALIGKYAPGFKGMPRIGQFKRVVQEVQIIDPHRVALSAAARACTSSCRTVASSHVRRRPLASATAPRGPSLAMPI